ncbi:hypothetical protein [Bradyrhizobium liaoningense]|uniref:hypothetical protein n=1 Tax=Bradyrhizobium liaoningense TaxID=43992 RepID=UPI001BA94372|nr:hypothetical protein [Bradyrhizobium liaoningense]MBR0908000.1 hypothetical protein [Bradyrhizobium liaoningense]
MLVDDRSVITFEIPRTAGALAIKNSMFYLFINIVISYTLGSSDGRCTETPPQSEQGYGSVSKLLQMAIVR